ncbi:DUF5994 family protein [Streptomyces longwoodensis]|uniref:DUF5994 family protein n=1 Tax=Streptomyces longwoodensis TaxID=68231 RepID=UPI0038175581
MLNADGPSRGLLDGAWWPRSRGLLRELPALADALADALHPSGAASPVSPSTPSTGR